jgi:hypothetical protein
MPAALISLRNCLLTGLTDALSRTLPINGLLSYAIPGKRTRFFGFIDGSFVSLDSTSIEANTSKNNSKSFDKNRFDKSVQPKSDKDCRLGVRTASNAYNEKNYEFYWGYKNHILVDAISGLPITEVTTPANVSDGSRNSPAQGYSFLAFPYETFFIADKGYDVKNIYNFVHDELHGHCFIPLNQRNSKKNRKTLPCGNLLCDAGFAMHKDGRQLS